MSSILEWMLQALIDFVTELQERASWSQRRVLLLCGVVLLLALIIVGYINSGSE